MGILDAIFGTCTSSMDRVEDYGRPYEDERAFRLAEKSGEEREKFLERFREERDRRDKATKQLNADRSKIIRELWDRFEPEFRARAAAFDAQEAAFNEMRDLVIAALTDSGHPALAGQISKRFDERVSS